MEEQIEKLMGNAGGSGRYQILILIIGFFVWSSLSLHNTSIPMLETVPLVKYNGTEVKLDYDICKEKYEVKEKYPFSWISEMNIECSRAKVSMIGSFTYSGLTAGSLVFSVMTKYLSYRHLIIIFVFAYVLFLFLTTIVNNLAFRLFCLFCLGICNGLANMSTMTLVSESVSAKKRSLFAGIINAGYSFCPIMYTPLYVLLGQWRYIFWLENVIGIACGVVYFFILENSPRMHFSKNEPEEAIKILRRIAAFNGKLEDFDSQLEDKEFDPLLRNDQEGVEKDLTVEMKPKYGYSALFKYKSVLYKFLIFTFMFMSTSFLTNAVVINTKTMAGNTYVIIVSLYCVEVIAGVCCGFLINLPILGRKKSLIGFYLGITVGFILTLLFGSNAIGGWLSMVVIRFCITGVYTSFYIYFMESYPTPIRSLGFGLNSTFGNLAGIVSPIIIEYINKYLLYFIFAILSGVNIFLTFFLKETVGKPMLETIEELIVPDVDKEKLVPGRESDINNLDKGKEPEKKEEKTEGDNLKEPLINKDDEKQGEEKKVEEQKEEKKEEEGLVEEKKEEEKKEEEKKEEEGLAEEKKEEENKVEEKKEDENKVEEKKEEDNKVEENKEEPKEN